MSPIDRVQDISLSQVSSLYIHSDSMLRFSTLQWLALTPPSLVKAHLNLDDETISKLSKVKSVVIGG